MADGIAIPAEHDLRLECCNAVLPSGLQRSRGLSGGEQGAQMAPGFRPASGEAN